MAVYYVFPLILNLQLAILYRFVIVRKKFASIFLCSVLVLMINFVTTLSGFGVEIASCKVISYTSPINLPSPSHITLRGMICLYI